MLVVVQEGLQMVLCWAALGAVGVFLVQAQELQETSTPVAVVAVVCQIQIWLPLVVLALLSYVIPQSIT
jgi:hypothetical protein